MTVEEVYIRGKYPDLEHVVKIARAEAKRLFNIKGKVMITEIEQTGSGYLVKVSFEGSKAPEGREPEQEML